MPAIPGALTEAQIDAFVTNGFVRIDNAFSTPLAEAARAILWSATGCAPDDPSGWKQPVIRLGHFTQQPFRDAANTAVLHRAYDQLVGEGRWLAPTALGTFPVRFPIPQDAGDTGWHVDVSFGTEAPDFLDWRVNVSSSGRALLMLFLFSDVTEDDAPTRIRVGSHSDVARYLAPAGNAGRSLREMLTDRPDWFDTGREALATGVAGRFTFATRSSCTPHRCTAANRSSSWLSHRC